MEFNFKEFEDLFNSAKQRTPEEIQKEKKELEGNQNRIEKSRKEFLNFARTLPGAEKESDDNPIISIKGEMVDGNYIERAVTKSDAINEFFVGTNFGSSDNNHVPRKK